MIVQGLFGYHRWAVRHSVKVKISKCKNVSARKVLCLILQNQKHLFCQEQLTCWNYQESPKLCSHLNGYNQRNKQSSAGKLKNVNSAVLEYIYCSLSPVVWILVWSLAWICYIPYHMWRSPSAQECCVKPFVWPGCLSECPLHCAFLCVHCIVM